jgi:hypothetical protein
VNLPAAPGKKESVYQFVAGRCASSVYLDCTEGSLFKYSPSNGQAEQIESVHANSIKSLALDAKKICSSERTTDCMCTTKEGCAACLA